MSEVLLETRGVSVRYGGVVANDSIDIEVRSGTCVGLIGANGAGKTTFIDALSGFTRVSEGSVIFEGRDITATSSHERAASGMVRTFQGLELFEDLTVAENLRVATESSRWWRLPIDVFRRRSRSSVDARVTSCLATLGLSDLADRLPGELSHGHRKLVAMARSLVADPKLLLLDEPAAGLDSDESADLVAVLNRLVATGTTLFLIDHDMNLVLSVCEDIYVLDFGTVVAHGSPSQIRHDPAVIAAYLGAESEPGPDHEPRRTRAAL